MSIPINQKTSFFDAFKKKCSFQHFSASEIERILIKTKIIITQERTKTDAQLKYYIKLLYSNDNLIQQYTNLQQICQRLINIKTNKIILQYVQKVRQHKNYIAEADGAVHQVKDQTLWIQNIAWYLYVKKLSHTEEFFNFCYHYYKGINIVEDISLYGKLFDDIKKCKLKVHQIRFFEAKDWLDYVLQQFPKQTLTQLLKLNDLFLCNNFTNIEIKQYFYNQFQNQNLKETHSHILPATSDYDSTNLRLQSSKYNNSAPESPISQIQNFKKMNTDLRSKDTQISIEEKFSLLVIKRQIESLGRQSDQKVFRICVVPFEEAR